MLIFDRAVSLSAETRIIAALQSVLNDLRCPIVIETGTYYGDGTTRIVIQAYGNAPPEKFYTIEASPQIHAQAQQRLAEFPFLECVNGLSVRHEEAVKWINEDTFLKNHQQVGNIYIDHEDPTPFYIAEVGGWGETPPQEDVLRSLLIKHRDDCPLLVLDSAGGIGLLEFNTVMEVMDGRPFGLFLDDINHVKHFRSFEQIVRSEDFRVIDFNFIVGWLVATHRGPAARLQSQKP